MMWASVVTWRQWEAAMTSLKATTKAITNSLLAVSLAGLLALTAGPASPALASVQAARARGGPSTAARFSASSWRVRTVLPESGSELTPSQVVEPGAGAARAGIDYALVATTTTGSTYRLRRTELATRSVREGPKFPVSELSLAAGYLWAYGPVFSGVTSVRLVLYQVSPRTLAVVRSWTLAPGRSPEAAIGVAVTAGPGHTVWVGYLRMLRRINAATGATVAKVTLPAGLSVGQVAVDPAGRHLYAAALTQAGAGSVFEYAARSGRLLASARHNRKLTGLAVLALTAVPGGVWASLRGGMLGDTLLLRQRGLHIVVPSAAIFGWPMDASTVYGGGALWLATDSGAVGCIAPSTGVVRHRTTLAALSGTGQLFSVVPKKHVIYALGKPGLITITPPPGCWA
jgi:outer membrane protein assembly factor BamB